MWFVTLKVPDKIYNNLSEKKELTYEDVINYYEESSFKYEKVWMKASEFKNYLLTELSNG